MKPRFMIAATLRKYFQESYRDIDEDERRRADGHLVRAAGG